MYEPTSNAFSIRRMLKKRFLDMVKSVPASKMGRILVVDEVASTYLDACVEQKDLFLTEVSLYEKLELPRNGYSGVEVIYLITPTWESIEKLVKDFTEGSELHSGPLYGGAYLFFTTELGDDLYQYLTQSPAASYIQNIVEYFVDFFVPESQVFTTKTPHNISELYSTTPNKNRHRALKDMAKKIVSLNVALGENPMIKYFKPDGELNTSEISFDLAELVQEEFDLLQRRKQYLQTIDPRQPRSTLIVLDRTVDLRAPLLHEITYQAVVHDLLSFPDDATYTYKYVDANGKELDKEGSLNEDDPIWVENRHISFDQCAQSLVAKITKLGNKKMVNNPEMSASAKLRQLRETLYSLPEYQDLKEKCSLHMSLSLECTELFTKLDIERLALLEQDLATGIRENGETSKHMIEEIVPILDDPSISPDNKLRILILYILSKDGLREETWQEINFHAQLDLNKKDNDAIRSLDRLGVKLNKSNKKGSMLSKKLKTFKEPTDFLMVARYVPMVKQIVENLVQNTLPPEIFPTMTTNHQGSGANGHVTHTFRHMAPKWTKRKKGSTLGECVTQKGRIIVFMIGGVTHSEMRSVYEISKELNREVIIGSTHVLPPWDFLDSLRALQTQVDQHDILPSIRSLSIDSTYSDQLTTRSSSGQAIQIPRSLAIPKSQSPALPTPVTPTSSESPPLIEPSIITPTSPQATFTKSEPVLPLSQTRSVSPKVESKPSDLPATDHQPIYNSIPIAASSPAVNLPAPKIVTSPPSDHANPPNETAPTPITSTANIAPMSRPSTVNKPIPPPKPDASKITATLANANIMLTREDPTSNSSLDIASSPQPSNNKVYEVASPKAVPLQVQIDRGHNSVPNGTPISPGAATSPASVISDIQSPLTRTDTALSTESTRTNVPTRRLYRPRPRSTLPDATTSGDNLPDSRMSPTNSTPTEPGNMINNLNPSRVSENIESYPSPSPSPPPLPVHPRINNQRAYSSSSSNSSRISTNQNQVLENRNQPAYNGSISTEYRPPLPQKPALYPSINSSSRKATPPPPQTSYNSNPFPPPQLTQSPPQLPNPIINNTNYTHNQAHVPQSQSQSQRSPVMRMPMPELHMPRAQTHFTPTNNYSNETSDRFPDPTLYMPNRSYSNTGNTPPIPPYNQGHPSVYSTHPTRAPLPRPPPPQMNPPQNPPYSQQTYRPHGRPLPATPGNNRQYQHLPQDDPIHQRYYR
ncbi:syntaxin binding protein 1 [Basidiobolus ranarum]|uniref:Syntaxin binding protein 1 n=1 Tax=Basidiobolus ranarum TaxID=34480 RepID=A0ABR2WXA1_9FUNG